MPCGYHGNSDNSELPAWLKTSPTRDQVIQIICKLTRKGSTPSEIGTKLRDSEGIT